MSASHIILKDMEGHPITINTETKVVIMELDNMFRFARQKLGWDEKYGNSAFGINRSIMNFILGSKMKLLIRFTPDDSCEYWITHDKLKKFKSSVFCLTFVSKNVQIYNIPVSLFRSKPNFSGVN